MGPRSFFSGTTYKNRLFIFGGEFYYNDKIKMRECGNDIQEFDF